MDYQKLIVGTKAYQKGTTYDRAYFESIRRRDVWGNISGLDDNVVKDVVLNFLNLWKCRISYGCAPELNTNLKKSAPLFRSLKNEKLETVNFSRVVLVNGNEMTIGDIIMEIFATISKFRGKTNATAASKTMHMINPQLFVLYDRTIREELGFSGSPSGYLGFMKKMQAILIEILNNFAKENKCDINKGKIEICNRIYKGKKTITKILDEYYYSKHTLGYDI